MDTELESIDHQMQEEIKMVREKYNKLKNVVKDRKRREGVSDMVAKGFMTQQQADAILGKTSMKIKLKQLDGVFKELSRFKILTSMTEDRRVFWYKTTDDGYVYWCPWTAYRNNTNFCVGFDSKQASASGVKWDTGTKFNGRIPNNWRGMTEGTDYVIRKASMTHEEAKSLWVF